MTRLSNSRFFLYIKAAGIVIIPALLFLLPYNYFDQRGPVCIVTLLTKNPCYGCGMTRACMRLIHFRFAEAADFNKLAFIVFPILAVVWGAEGWRTLNALIKKS